MTRVSPPRVVDSVSFTVTRIPSCSSLYSFYPVLGGGPSLTPCVYTYKYIHSLTHKQSHTHSHVYPYPRQRVLRTPER